MSRCQSSLLDGFTDDWDAALLSEGTLRPKRAASAMNLREAMKTIAKPPGGAVTKEDLENHFSRSMKLLGFDGVESVSSKTSHKPKTSNVSPRTITRLEKPTVSYEDIRNAVTDGVDRKVLSQAAYERWYFRKVDEERERRMTGLFELDKRSRLFDHGLTFVEWLEKKNIEKKTKKTIPEKKPVEKSARKRLPTSCPATKEAAEKAYKDWLNKKTSEEARKKQKLKDEREARASDKSRENAEKAFEEWKRTHDEKLKTMEERRRKKEMKIKEKEKEEKDRTLQDSEKAFNAWLSNKNQLLQREEEKNKRRSTEKSLEEQKRLAEKRYEARQAFEDWLEKKLELEATKVPPPPPKVTKSVQTEDPVKPSTPVRKCRNVPKHLIGPWQYPPTVNKNSKAKVQFAEAINSSKSYDYKDLSKIQELSANKALMMLYHKKDPNYALYYARDII